MPPGDDTGGGRCKRDDLVSGEAENGFRCASHEFVREAEQSVADQVEMEMLSC